MSLRSRLVAATTLVALIALGVAGIATYQVFTRTQLRPVDDALESAYGAVQAVVSDGGSPTETAIGQAAPGLFVEIRDVGGSMVVSTPSRRQGDDPTFADLSGLAWLEPGGEGGSRAAATTYTTVPVVSGDGPMRVRVSSTEDGSTIIIGQSLHEVDETRGRLVRIQIVVAVCALALSFGLGWLVVAFGLRPLRNVERTAQAIADEGDLERQIPGAGPSTEIGRLAATMNTMLARIRAAFAERAATERALRISEDRMRRFVADVSHELRTPLTAVGAYTELIERGASDQPDDLERALHGIAAENARMRELVEELLLLARIDEGRPMQTDRVDLAEVVADAVRTARTVGADWPISLQVDSVVTIRGDTARLRQVIDNLLSNVRTHTPAGTQTTVRVATSDGFATVSVLDNGPGLDPSQADQMFERFYRADISRSRSSGGSGLGLAIVDAIVGAHRGTIRVETAPGHGLCVAIRLPAEPDVPTPSHRPDTQEDAER